MGGQHLTYTHGYGVVVAPANARERDGQPRLRRQGRPDRARRPTRSTRPAVYFGEKLRGYVDRRTRRDEVDYSRRTARRSHALRGRGRRELSSCLRTAAFAAALRRLQPADLELHHRRVEDPLRPRHQASGCRPSPRSSTSTPTRTRWSSTAGSSGSSTPTRRPNRYPYAQRAETGTLARGQRPRARLQLRAQLGEGRRRRLRRHGQVLRDRPDDPIIEAYRKAFPELFTDDRRCPRPDATTSATRRTCSGCRPPCGAATTSRTRGASTPGQRRWDVAQDPGTASPAGHERHQRQGRAGPTPTHRIDPYYLFTELPGEEDRSFVLLRPFVPTSDDDSRAA